MVGAAEDPEGLGYVENPLGPADGYGGGGAADETAATLVAAGGV